jgi:transposase
LPDFEQIHKELAKPGVNLTLLWDEYCLTARMAGKIPYMYTQFNKMYRDFAVRNKATMHLHRKPGDSLEIDWAGQKAHILDSTTGEVLDAFVFVSTLSSSQYTYAEGFLDMSTESWISAHIHAFQFYGGVPRSLINDNLKTGVVTPHFVDPLLNRTYQELAEHYGTVILPARVKRPKDKPSVESSVSNVSTWIIAALRHQQFFSLADLNQGIREKLKELNRKPFQKKPTSREQAFRDEERDLLLPLPVHPFEIAQWKTATVQFNYHITVEKMYNVHKRLDTEFKK